MRSKTHPRERLSLRKASAKFREIKLRDKLIVNASLLLVIAVLTWRLGGDILVVTGVTAGILAGVTFLLGYLSWLGVAIVWMLNLFLMPVAAQGYTLVFSDGIEDAFLDFNLSLFILFTSSLLYTLVAYRRVPGRLWLNLGIVFIIQSMLALLILAFISDQTESLTPLGASFGVILAGLYLIGRIIVGYRRNKPVKFSGMKDKDIEDLRSQLDSKLTERTRVITHQVLFSNEEHSALVLVQPHTVAVIYPVSTQAPLSIKKNKLYMDNKTVDTAAIGILAETAALAATAKRAEVHTIVTGNKLLPTQSAVRQSLSTREGQYAGDITWVNKSQLLEYLKKLQADSPVSKKQRAALLKSIVPVEEEPSESNKELDEKSTEEDPDEKASPQ